MTSFDGLQFDAFSPAQGSISPAPLPLEGGIPVNPLLFPADWTASVSIKTRWQTDVVDSLTGPREAMALMPRPSREVTVDVVGPAHAESFTLLQSLMQHAYVESPIPLFSDATPVETASWVSVNTLLELTGDFSYRRFFLGGRVAIFNYRHQSTDRERYSLFGIVKEISGNRMLVEIETPVVSGVFAVHRDISRDDLVAPCIDCEVTPSSQTKALTDGVVQASLTWTEKEGPGTLPALWPAFEDENSWVVDGIAQRIDFAGVTRPLFPATIDWSDGVEIEIENPVESTSLGRSRSLHQASPAFLTFSATVTAATRREAWSLMRFFDAAQGRRGVFAFPHPVQAFEVVSRDSQYMEIEAISSLGLLRSRLRYLYLGRSDGTAQVVRVTSVTQFGNHYRLNWGPVIADHALVNDVREAFLCSFDSDSLEEEWLTSGVARFRIDLREVPEHGAATIPDDLFSYEVTPQDPIRSVPDCSLFLKAGAECYDEHGQICTNWPGMFYRLKTVKDISKESWNVGEFRGYGQATAGSTQAAIVRPFTDAFFGSQPVFMNANLDIYPAPRGDQNRFATAWGTTGWTIFCVFAPQGGLSSGVSIRRILAMQGSHLTFNVSVIGGGYANGYVEFGTPSSTIIPGSFPVDDLGQARVLAVRFDFVTNNVQAWLDGQPWIPKTATPAFNPSGSITSANFGTSAGGATPVTASFLRSVFGGTVTRMVTAANIHYRRALTQSEMRQVQEGLSGIYNTRRSQYEITVL